MREKTTKVRLTNMSFSDCIFAILIVFMIMQMSGCDECNGTNSGLECAGKAAKAVQTEFMKGYSK